jgi:tetrahydromethanopterin S-methyltransferase subunit H
MFSFTKNQEIFDLSGIKIGGQPGMYPTVLFGGAFFKGDPDFEKVQHYLHSMLSISKKTGNPVIPDFFIRKEEYIEDIISFIIKTLPRNYPFSIDIIEPSIKMQTLEHLHNYNLLSQTIYNSIHIGMKDEELEYLQKYTPKAAIIVAFNPKDKSPDGKVEVLENGANLTQKGLLELTKKVGIKNILVDTAALAPGENSGASIAAIPVIKEEYGLPTGCALHNVVEKSKWLTNFESVKKIVDSASNINIPLFGGDFTIFGPMDIAQMVIPIIAWQDILISEYAENYFGITPIEFHPRRKLS